MEHTCNQAKQAPLPRQVKKHPFLSPLTLALGWDISVQSSVGLVLQNFSPEVESETKFGCKQAHFFHAGSVAGKEWDSSHSQLCLFRGLSKLNFTALSLHFFCKITIPNFCKSLLWNLCIIIEAGSVILSNDTSDFFHRWYSCHSLIAEPKKYQQHVLIKRLGHIKMYMKIDFACIKWTKKSLSWQQNAAPYAATPGTCEEMYQLS